MTTLAQSQSQSHAQVPRAHAAGGFTLLEMMIVLGMLSGFVLFLVQILATGVSLFDQGESGQALSDRANAASVAIEDALGAITGPERDAIEAGPPSARLLVQWVPLGLQPGATTPFTQVLRSHVQLDEASEAKLLRQSLRPEAERTARTRTPEDVELRLEELVASAPRAGRGTMLLLAWPGDKTGEFLELRRGLFLVNEKLPIRKDHEVGLFDPELVGGDELPGDVVLARTETIAATLLHFELQLWSQHTKDWGGRPQDGGPEIVWDSARAGWLSDAKDPLAQFTLDLGSQSLTQPTDDVWPRWVRAVFVVALEESDAILIEAASAEETQLRLTRTERLPDAGFAKVGSEWVQYAGLDGHRLTGVRRGQRGTRPQPHASGAPVRTGKTVSLPLRLQTGRDNWNG